MRLHFLRWPVVTRSSRRAVEVNVVPTPLGQLESRILLSNTAPVILDQTFTVRDDLPIVPQDQRLADGDIIGVIEASDGDVVPGLQFFFGDPSGQPLVLGLTSFDDGTTDGLANQIYESVDGSDSTITLRSNGVPLATGLLERLEIITDPDGQSFAEFVATFISPVGDDTAIFDEIIAVSGGTGTMRATTGTFDVEGQILDDQEASLFTSTGTGLFFDGSTANVNASADFNFAAIASNLHPTFRYFDSPVDTDAPYQEINLGGGYVTSVMGLPVASEEVIDVEDPLTFEVVGGDAEGVFEVDPHTGAISVIDAARATRRATFTIDVVVTDTGTPALSSQATMSINVVSNTIVSLPNTNGSIFEVTPDIAHEAFLVERVGTLPAGANWSNIQHGDFDGDGRLDILAQRTDLLSWHVGLNTEDGFKFTRWASDWRSIEDVVVADFNGDGRDDIAGRRPATGTWRLGLSDGLSFQGQSFGRDLRGGQAEVAAVMIGNFGGDSAADRAIYDSDTRHWYVNLTSTGQWSAWGGFWPSGDEVQQWIPGDFNGDDLTDIAGIRNSGRVDAAFSLGDDFTEVNGRSEHVATLPAGNYSWAAAGDFENDFVDELVAQGPDDHFYITKLTSGQVRTPTASVQQAIAHPTVADINADGKDDIFGTSDGEDRNFVTLLGSAAGLQLTEWAGMFPSKPEKFGGFAGGYEVEPLVRSFPRMDQSTASIDALLGNEDERLALLLSI